jgi:hypothetical protein
MAMARLHSPSTARDARASSSGQRSNRSSLLRHVTLIAYGIAALIRTNRRAPLDSGQIGRSRRESVIFVECMWQCARRLRERQQNSRGSLFPSSRLRLRRARAADHLLFAEGVGRGLLLTVVVGPPRAPSVFVECRWRPTSNRLLVSGSAASNRTVRWC